jgi:hypothetical protein
VCYTYHQEVIDMKSSIALRFPNGLAKAFTLSYDDDTATNRHLVELINKYQVKGTFNLNAGLVGIDNENDPNVYRPLSLVTVRTSFFDESVGCGE